MPEDEMVFDGLLTKEEFFKLAAAIRRDGAIDEEELNRLTRWASSVLAGAELARMLMEGWLSVSGWDGDEPRLIPTDDTLEFIGNVDFDAPMLEEMRCSVS